MPKALLNRKTEVKANNYTIVYFIYLRSFISHNQTALVRVKKLVFISYLPYFNKLLGLNLNNYPKYVAYEMITVRLYCILINISISFLLFRTKITFQRWFFLVTSITHYETVLLRISSGFAAVKTKQSSVLVMRSYTLSKR